MRHPSSVWSDPSFADEPLDDLRHAYLDHLRGRAKPTAEGTVAKYGKSLLSFIRYLKRQGKAAALADLTPANVNGWVQEQRRQGKSEHGIASRLTALKVFSNKYLHRELEVTTVDLLRKVPRIEPPDHPQRGLSEAERDQLLACLDRPTYEDCRDRALVATFLSTGLRFFEVLELSLDALDRIKGDIVVAGKGGRIRQAKLSPRALKLVREYLRERPRSESDRLWLTAAGEPISYFGGMSIMKRLRARSGIERLHWHLFRHGFAQTALERGAHPGLVQEMLGHASGTMTRRYLGHVKQQEAARQMPQYAPY